MNSPTEIPEGTKRPRDRQRAETRDRLFLAALDEFRSVGFARAQIDRIAQRAGVVRGTFYFHFPTKEHVLLELQARTQERVVATLRKLDRRQASLVQVLAALCDGLAAAEALVGDPGLMRDMMALYVQQPADATFQEMPESMADAVGALFEALARRGELQSGLDPQQAARLALCAVFGVYAVAAADAEAHRRELEGLAALLRDGLAPRPAPAR